MKKILVILYLFITVVLVVATIFEALYGTPAAKEYIYGSSWFFALWAVLGIWGVVYLYKRKMWKRPAVLMLHTAFIVILLGANITWIFGERGVVHLREGVTQQNFVRMQDTLVRPLPFALQLQKFSVAYYPATQAPSDYVSEVLVIDKDSTVTSHTISMNKILVTHGYRLYQTSFDEDHRGTILTLNHDPVGIGVTYAGYALMLLTMLFVLFSKNGGFRKLLRNPVLKNSMFGLLLCLVFLPSQVSAQGTKKIKPIWQKEFADSASRRQVVYNDRITPFNTLARDFTLKLYGKPSYKGLTAEQVIGSWLLFPDVWKNEPMIAIKNDELRASLGVEGKYARYMDFFTENGDYKLGQLWQEQKPGEQLTALQKAITQADEKVSLVTMLQQRQLIKSLPDDGSVAPLSNAKIEAEIVYNAIPFSKISFMVNLSIGFLAFFFLFYTLLRRKTEEKSLALRIIEKTFLLLLWLSFTFQTIGIALHGYVCGRIPLSNGYETMLFLSWSIVLIAIVLQKRFKIIIPFGFLLSGFALLVAWLGQRNPQITPLMPVLHSPILSGHVLTIMVSYALFAFTAINALLALFLHSKDKTAHAASVASLTLVSKVMLYPATFLLGIGIFLGAVWANISWGGYWSWDPKETWALITFLLYAGAFHTESVPKFNKPLFFHVYMLIAFAAVLMTYFGVNELLGGMHSYK